MPRENSFSNPNVADWTFVSNQTHYTPMHWLCYWNDKKSIEYILSLVESNASVENLEKLMTQSYNQMTPIDMAGKNGSVDAALLILNFFTTRFKFIEMLF